MKKFHSLVALVSVLAVASIARASTIDFEGLSVGSIAGDSIVLSVDGVSVRFSGSGLQVRDVSFLGSGADRVLSSASDAGPILVEFLGGYTSSYVEFQNWLPLGGGEVDYVLGNAYDSSNGLLDTQTNANSIFHLDGPGIASAVFQEANPGEGFLLDNFSFSATSSVPDSGLTVVMLGAVFAGLVSLRSRMAGRN